MSQPPSDEGERPAGERIAKLLARAGIASRREVERMIADGRVRIGDQVVTTPATILPNLTGVSVDGKPVRAAEAPRLFLFHKPSGLLTAERDTKGRPTIYTALRNALPAGTPRMMPIGRLDLNTEGLLLLTNDGELKRAMELPASGVPRTYRARTYGDITQAQLEELIEGITIGDIQYGSIDANMGRRTGRNQWIELTLTEGKNREVRRVLEHLGLEVSRLMRISYGPFELGDLQRGSAVEVRAADVERFRKSLPGMKDLSGVAFSAPVVAEPAETPSEPAPRRAAARKAPAPRKRAEREQLDTSRESVGRSKHHPQTPSSEEEAASRRSSPPPLQRRGPGGGAGKPKTGRPSPSGAGGRRATPDGGGAATRNEAPARDASPTGNKKRTGWAKATPRPPRRGPKK